MQHGFPVNVVKFVHEDPGAEVVQLGCYIVELLINVLHLYSNGTSYHTPHLWKTRTILPLVFVCYRFANQSWIDKCFIIIWI